MKRIFLIVLVIILSLEVNSQIRRGISPYRFNQNMYLGANIGPNAFLADGFSEYGFKGSIGLSQSVFVGYNFTELLSARAFGSFGQMNWPGVPSAGSLYPAISFSTMSMGMDVLLNVFNIFDTYNLKRPFELSIYAGSGIIAREKGEVEKFDSEYIGMLYKGGIKADYRLNYSFELNLDITGNILNEKFSEKPEMGRKFDAFPEIKLGVTYQMRGGSMFR